MNESLFFFTLIVGLSVLFCWAFRVLPKEEWQFLAVVPLPRRDAPWIGTNLTYYGVFTACGVCFAVMFLVLLLGSIGNSLGQILWVMIPLLILTVPAAKLVARYVEGKSSTLTIGGASFIGMLAAPWVVLGLNFLFTSVNRPQMAMVPTLAALWIAFAFGEGIGRLACISFGCCYGKPLAEFPPVFRWLFQSMAFRFVGKTKKAVYAGRCEGIPLFPVQGLTAVVNSTLGVLGTLLYLHGRYDQALVAVALGTQGWRVVSELFRTDYRGNGFVSAYQWMAFGGAWYSVFLPGLWMGSVYSSPRIDLGLAALWDIDVMLTVQILWLIIFFFTGVSRVTKASVSAEVCYEKI